MMIDPYGPPPIDSATAWIEGEPKDSLQANQSIVPNSFTAPTSAIIALVLSISLLCLSLAALTWGAVKLSNSAIALTKNAIQQGNTPAH